MKIASITASRRLVLVPLAVCALGIAACGNETAAPGTTGPGSSANGPREWEGSLYPRPHDEYADYEGTLYPRPYGK